MIEKLNSLYILEAQYSHNCAIIPLIRVKNPNNELQYRAHKTASHN